MNYKEAIGKVLRDERLAQRRTLRYVKDRAFISIGHLSEIERGGKEISGVFLEQIAKTLGVETGEIVVKAGLLMLGWETEAPDTIADLPIDEYADLLLKN